MFIFPPIAEIVDFLYLTINGALSMRYNVSFGMSGNSKRQITYHQYEKIKYLWTETGRPSRWHGFSFTIINKDLFE